MTALRSFPRLIHPHRWCDNGDFPDSRFVRVAANAVNHGLAYRRKMIASAAMPLGQASVGGTVNYWRFRFRSGYAATRLTVDALAGLDNTGSGTDPYVLVGVTPSGGAETTKEAHYGGNESSGQDDAPWTWNQQAFHFDIDPLTTYEVRIAGVDYARPLSFRAYEYANPTVDASTDYYCEIAPTAELPITDADRERLLKAVSETWLENGSMLLCWPGMGRSSPVPSVTGTTWTNLIDLSSTSVSASTPGFYFASAGAGGTALTELTPWVRLKDGDDLPVTFCAYGGATGLGTPSGEVRLVDSGGAGVSLTISSTAGWHTTNTTWSNVSSIAGSGKVDLQIRGTGAGYTCAVTAVCLYTRR